MKDYFQKVLVFIVRKLKNSMTEQSVLESITILNETPYCNRIYQQWRKAEDASSKYRMLLDLSQQEMALLQIKLSKSKGTPE